MSLKTNQQQTKMHDGKNKKKYRVEITFLFDKEVLVWSTHLFLRIVDVGSWQPIIVQVVIFALRPKTVSCFPQLLNWPAIGPGTDEGSAIVNDQTFCEWSN